MTIYLIERSTPNKDELKIWLDGKDVEPEEMLIKKAICLLINLSQEKLDNKP